MEYRFKWNRSRDMWHPVRYSHRNAIIVPVIGDTLIFEEKHTSFEYMCVQSDTMECDRSCMLHPDRASGPCCKQFASMTCRTWTKFIDKTQVEDLI